MKLACVFMASGHSKRFGSDKLVYPLSGIPMVCHAMETLPKHLFNTVVVVTRSTFVADLARKRGFMPVMNYDKTDDTSITIRLGMYALPEHIKGCMFTVCDQPYLKSESIKKLADDFIRQPESIAALSWENKRGNPVIFPSCLFEELRCLPRHNTGRYIIDKHPDMLRLVSASKQCELWDIDEPGDTL